jgi:hypothetical protein
MSRIESRFACPRVALLIPLLAGGAGRAYPASHAARSRFNFIMSASRVYIMWPAS